MCGAFAVYRGDDDLRGGDDLISQYLALMRYAQKQHINYTLSRSNDENHRMLFRMPGVIGTL